MEGNVSVQIEFDEAKRQFSVLPGRDAPRSDVVDAVIRAVTSRPEIATWDCLADFRSPLSGSYIFDLRPLIPLFDQEASRPALTVFLTHQPRTTSWIGLLNHQFKSRRFCVASTTREALESFDKSVLRNARPSAAL